MGSLFRGSQRSVAFYTDSYRYANKELALRLDGDVIFETQGVLSLDPASKMMGTTTSASDVDKTAVLDQLERILGSTVFRNSKRHSSLLRHLVERSVAGTVADLKERTLGVEVFGRPANYDNYADPVVRISAGEVRKRIAQYYHEPDRERELRIELPLGSYVPEFHKPAFAPEQTPAKPEPESVPNKPSSVLSRRTILIAVSVGVLATALLLWRFLIPSGVLQQFWRPYLSDGSPVIICLAGMSGPSRAGNSPGGPVWIAWPDSATSTKVARLQQAFGQPLDLRPGNSVTFQDLRDQSAVLIGAFNDAWTLRLTENLRFEFQREGSLMWILDRKTPSSRTWSADFSNPKSPGRDYAVVSRLLTGRSGRPVLTIAGLGGLGTEVAGDFVTNQSFLEAMASQAPRNWQNRNMQIVIETEVIDGHAGPPKIEAIHVW